MIDGVETPEPLQLLQKVDPASNVDVDTREGERDDPFGAIRCPLCRWHPVDSSRWCCENVGTPEPFFHACRTIWNTFLTRGKCPGCGHQWLWTSCHYCEGWSLHEDWYEREDPRH